MEKESTVVHLMPFWMNDTCLEGDLVYFGVFLSSFLLKSRVFSQKEKFFANESKTTCEWLDLGRKTFM